MMEAIIKLAGSLFIGGIGLLLILICSLIMLVIAILKNLYLNI